ncbi:bifunctional 2-C-methyl-D-erythritol 4-phosphate cytidylyltransferase/2-C-methyl-D-erythritol 2,4-cyclodiphosphate synthase [Cognatiyoonia sp. IB215446]|uniref:bifunctional 2-C-methyl-D-erythritol 4-phosphate cytidylyltransferase/2-C-methyl-D-erythritol 2,4-cyclodiphosphate synthase n=1 Tax=Cognatiyoonia sp. IB215446 TaxID=3097355 RepID=UPI002A1297A3|nr:bifunctional 2-C-methyl-D-erythritol 4-phosphate cytidylyltransferase/2-C-methyl-D-erythritol 2,4-cyclodiphosphate synthase [Cognatiyoonia sp. IB215446]MDX8349040.1 bifunctional 2-C-methyl-D-erythritol 4-phosphate cytidylyltransferase/2-C-methyl-D-erythritol 2,4-cyclodiphosphate synthase [Cognatiyoonia sp. IB215446]
MQVTAIIVAAGRGTRAGGDLPKQWQMLRGKPVLEWTLGAFKAHADVHDIVVVMHKDDIATGRGNNLCPARIVPGGETRKASVLAGLNACPQGTDRVLIHDAARPLVSASMIDRVLTALETQEGAAPALPVTDTLWHGADNGVTGLQDRAGLFRAQTPQGFHLAPLLAAHEASNADATDDVAVAKAAGLHVAIVPGDENNIKITHPGDLARAERLMGQQMDIRCGNGYDVHRFGPGDHVRLCGVEIPHRRGLQGHSDADVGMHAVTDAIYGALGQGDIGQHFPPSDPQWKGAASHIFLEHAVALAGDSGFAVSNVDCTLVCEYPKIGPHQPAMKAALARIMQLDANRISVKATTSEKLGFTGREEGIAALATVTLVKA